MSKALLFYLFLALPLFGITQPTLTSLTVNHPDSNVVFIGVDNYLEIGGIASVNNIELSSTKASASVTRINPTKFLIRVSTLGDTPIEVYDNSRATKRLLLSKTFMAQVLPGPEARISNTTDSILTIAAITERPTIHVILPNSSFRHPYSLVSFVLSIKSATGSVMHTFEPTTGNQLTREQIDIIKGLSTGDQLLFTELKVSCPACRNFKLPPYNVTIK
jgi:hypothetical protein